MRELSFSLEKLLFCNSRESSLRSWGENRTLTSICVRNTDADSPADRIKSTSLTISDGDTELWDVLRQSSADNEDREFAWSYLKHKYYDK